MAVKKFLIEMDLDPDGYDCKITDIDGNPVPSTEIYDVQRNLTWVAAHAAGREAAATLQLGALYYARLKRGVGYYIPVSNTDGKVFVKSANRDGVVESEEIFHFYEPQRFVLAKNQPQEVAL